MPGFDRTGPAGQGSMTGRGLGQCAPTNKPDVENTASPNEASGVAGARRSIPGGWLRCRGPRGCGRGFNRGYGRGGGRGFGR